MHGDSQNPAVLCSKQPALIAPLNWHIEIDNGRGLFQPQLLCDSAFFPHD